MPNISITKNGSNRIVGFTPADKKRYAKYVKQLTDMEPGEILEISVWFPRNSKFHRLHMRMLRTVWENQDRFDDFEAFRKWVQIGAGYYSTIPGPNGKDIDVSKSIKWNSMDEDGMSAHHLKCKEFLRGERAYLYLWPALDAEMAANLVEEFLAEFN